MPGTTRPEAEPLSASLDGRGLRTSPGPGCGCVLGRGGRRSQGYSQTGGDLEVSAFSPSWLPVSGRGGGTTAIWSCPFLDLRGPCLHLEAWLGCPLRVGVCCCLSFLLVVWVCWPLSGASILLHPLRAPGGVTCDHLSQHIKNKTWNVTGAWAAALAPELLVGLPTAWQLPAGKGCALCSVPWPFWKFPRCWSERPGEAGLRGPGHLGTWVFPVFL